MSNKLLIIDGEDFTDYISADGGYGITRNDVDSSDAGRTMDATMHRGRVAVKTTLKIKCRPLTGAEARKILNAIYPEYVTISCIDPRIGRVDNVQVYCSTVPAEYLFTKPDGTEWWRGISFSLIWR